MSVSWRKNDGTEGTRSSVVALLLSSTLLACCLGLVIGRMKYYRAVFLSAFGPAAAFSSDMRGATAHTRVQMPQHCRMILRFRGVAHGHIARYVRVRILTGGPLDSRIGVEPLFFIWGQAFSKRTRLIHYNTCEGRHRFHVDRRCMLTRIQ